ncbi:hypothetical protein [Paenibacillus hexagrammi]|uniref:DUF5668 domain-containing protein n=1 Tax=Paenibacillus hexagrammi TaxID=2908839 RepID=A0ABY3SFX5_9BACL|nr:hypothetical protein [Paenibacillus sp. YPD9-1]UJF32933.1 hypothetical protein L0M14_25705 [Paenibacillus sp. YPD9-1]
MSLNRMGVLGPLLVIAGCFLLFHGESSMGTGTIFASLWPTLFVLPLGVFFHWMYFYILQRRGVGLLVPGGILLTTGMVCQMATWFDSWGTLWPGFLLAVAVGLFELYWFGGRNRWLLIPINILTALSVLFFIVFSIGSLLGMLYSGQPVIAIALLAAGTLLMLKQRRDRHPL